MGYSDQASLIKTLRKYSKSKGSIRSYFTDFLKENIGKSAYGRSKKVDEVFFIGDPRSQRSLLSDYDLNNIPESNQMDADDNQTIMLLNDYISRIDFRKTESSYQMKTLIAIFLRRGFRDYYYKLKMPKQYEDLTRSVYKGIIIARVKIMEDLKRYFLGVLDGSILTYRNMDMNHMLVANTFMRADVTVTDELYELVTTEPNDLDIFDEGSPEATIDAMGLGILSARSERVCSKNVFPTASKNQLKLMKKILVDYHNLWKMFDPIDLRIICYLVDISTSTYGRYKNRMVKELIRLSNQNSYEDIIPYLMEDEQ